MVPKIIVTVRGLSSVPFQGTDLNADHANVFRLAVQESGVDGCRAWTGVAINPGMPLDREFARPTILYRGREDRFYCGLPSLRTGRADLPHPALRSMCLLQGLTRELVGRG